MTYKQAKLLDLILNDFLKKENKTFGNLTDLHKVIDNNEKFKKLTKEEINDLLYIARLEQKNFPTLFSGSSLLSVNEQSVSDFLRKGGFKSIRKKQQKELFVKRTLFIITILTFILVAIQVHLQVTTLKTSQKEPTELKTKSNLKGELQKDLSTDSSDNRYHKSNPVNIQAIESDSLR